MTSLEKTVQEAVERFREEQQTAAKKEQEARKLAIRVHVDRRYPGSVVAHLRDLMLMLPERAYMHLQALFSSHPTFGRLELSRDLASFTTLGGHVLFLSPSEKITQLAHVVNTKSPFACTVAVQLRDFGYTSAREFRDTYGGNLMKLVQSLPNVGPTLEEHWNPNGAEDAARWSAFMPTKRSHIGFYATQDNKVYLLMRTHSGSAILSGVQSVIGEPDMTAEKFVEDPRVKWMHGIALRNAVRVMFHIISKLQLNVPTTHDYQTFTDNSRLTAYRTVIPDIVVIHDTHRLSRRYGEHAVFFRDAIDGSQGIGPVLVHSDITKGYIMMNPLSDADDKTMPVFPMTTGKIPRADRTAYTIDERDEHIVRIRTLESRTELLSARKYNQPSGAADLAPIVVVRS